MTAFDLTFNGVGTGHHTWLQLYQHRYDTLAMAKQIEGQSKLRCWHVLALTMEELAKVAMPSSNDHEYWALVAHQINASMLVVKANPSWYQIPRADRSEPRNSWLPPHLLKAGGAA